MRRRLRTTSAKYGPRLSMADLVSLNAQRWEAAKLTRDFSAVAKRLLAHKAVYQDIEHKTGVPWFVVAAIHYRERNGDFAANLANGDPWNQVTTHVPQGIGPFKSFADAAVYALTNCHPYAAKNKDWSAGGAMTLIERYNGMAYANRGLPSPYVWSGTDQYVIGKVIRDHGPIENIVDKQLGCAGLIKTMALLDPSIQLGKKKFLANPKECWFKRLLAGN